ncbi:hypothetical protein ACIRU3_38185 [Streptomyces sp. NPDC101151]|uniref:hypothetical protein n=1 Tax=Streptomyces sp. NPDC101151 TaxID=3366115 RepID=UPI0038047364
MTQQLWNSRRHGTAIGRVGLSLPARRAVGDLQLAPGVGGWITDAGVAAMCVRFSISASM